LILAFTESDKVLSGLSYQMFGLTGCLLTAAVMVVISGFLIAPLCHSKGTVEDLGVSRA